MEHRTDAESIIANVRVPKCFADLVSRPGFVESIYEKSFFLECSKMFSKPRKEPSLSKEALARTFVPYFIRNESHFIFRSDQKRLNSRKINFLDTITSSFASIMIQWNVATEFTHNNEMLQLSKKWWGIEQYRQHIIKLIVPPIIDLWIRLSFTKGSDLLVSILF